MWNYTKSFFSKKRAEEFAKQLEKQGAEDIAIWSGRDAFDQTQYTVKWNLWK